jgi:hypothetical protein
MGVCQRGIHVNYFEVLLTSTHIYDRQYLRFHRHTLFRAVGDRETGIILRIL